MLDRVEAIVIKTVDYGETNKIITLYTKERGKIGVMARGAKKPKSQLSAVSQPFIYGSYVIYKGSGLGTLNQGDPIKTFRKVREDLVNASYAMYMAELIDKLTEENKRYMWLFDWYYLCLVHMEEGADPEVLTRIFEMKMLDVAGISPQLEKCVCCGSHDDPQAFSIRYGGFICRRCIDKDTHAFPCSMQTVRLLRLFYDMNLHRLGNISLKAETKQELKQIIRAYYDEYSGVVLKSRRFLDQLDRMNLGPNIDT
ncbi:DNA repair protein RecO [Alkalicoccobacillus murimartini]|uniref:DNA repair protein RecO n=1 Tax=Alkalicoccobacillus murimartini TaxID=171685 RepID=A0ABT9YCK7_9BACI|nr:DNA repair protein RecO [Alkalicoccobacillus murimartini]MDQ0205547.1 DNA repair protein RecO (recombination protein O) [Alkalicoccobacillus murimartini]